MMFYKIFKHLFVTLKKNKEKDILDTEKHWYLRKKLAYAYTLIILVNQENFITYPLL
jgi:hypothetical protein